MNARSNLSKDHQGARQKALASIQGLNIVPQLALLISQVNSLPAAEEDDLYDPKAIEELLQRVDYEPRMQTLAKLYVDYADIQQLWRDCSAWGGRKGWGALVFLISYLVVAGWEVIYWLVHGNLDLVPWWIVVLSFLTALGFAAAVGCWLLEASTRRRMVGLFEKYDK